MKVQTKLIASGSLPRYKASKEIFSKIDRHAEDWNLFSGGTNQNTNLSFSVHKISTGFTFESLFKSFSCEPSEVAYETDEVMQLISQLNQTLPTIPSSTYFLVCHEEKFYVLRAYKRSVEECELYAYKYEETDSWATLDSRVFVRK